MNCKVLNDFEVFNSVRKVGNDSSICTLVHLYDVSIILWVVYVSLCNA